MVITIPALVGPRIGPDMCVRAPPPPLQRGTTKPDKQWTPPRSRWQDFKMHNRLATRESQVLSVLPVVGLDRVTKLHNNELPLPAFPFPGGHSQSLYACSTDCRHRSTWERRATEAATCVGNSKRKACSRCQRLISSIQLLSVPASMRPPPPLLP